MAEIAASEFYDQSSNSKDCSDSYDWGDDSDSDIENRVRNPISYETSADESGFFSIKSNSPGETSKSKNEINSVQRRKQLHPTKSPPLYDPDFRGVIITMKNVKVNNEWKFVITKQYQLSPKRRHRRKFTEYVDSDSDDGEVVPAPVIKEKHCASCSVTKTPLWRDAEDGTPLCNACGIRYKKYKIRCAQCWHIPKKEEGSPTCKFCGSNFYPKPW